MNRGGKQGAVVVAVDNDGSAGDAVDWAAAEAAPHERITSAEPPEPAQDRSSGRGERPSTEQSASQPHLRNLGTGADVQQDGPKEVSDRRHAPTRADIQNVHPSWLYEVAVSASRDAAGAPVELLGDYLLLLADAATSGRKPHPAELDAVGLLGRRAAELGVSAGTAVQLYLSAARRLWQQLPMVIRSRDNQAVRNAALLRGDADVGRLAERAEPFGLDMLRPHQVALAAPTGHLDEATPAISSLEHAIVQEVGDRDVLVATKDGRIVVVAPPDTDMPKPRTGTTTLGDLILAGLSRSTRGRPWRVTVGRPYPGSYGIARSYEEAREGLTMAVRLHLDTPVIHAEQLLIYRVLLRDQPAIADLVRTVLGGLVRARGGAEPLLATLDTYFAAGSVTTETARRLHLSVRASPTASTGSKPSPDTIPPTPHSGSPSTPPYSARNS
jgi:hypothetical protein